MQAIKMLNKMHNSKADKRTQVWPDSLLCCQICRRTVRGRRRRRYEGRNVINMGHEHSDLETTALKNKDKLSDGAERQNPKCCQPADRGVHQLQKKWLWISTLLENRLLRQTTYTQVNAYSWSFCIQWEAGGAILTFRLQDNELYIVFYICSVCPSHQNTSDGQVTAKSLPPLRSCRTDSLGRAVANEMTKEWHDKCR